MITFLSVWKIFSINSLVLFCANNLPSYSLILNRFTKVHVESLTHNDLIVIASSIFPQLNNQSQIISNMIQFNSLIHEDTMVKMAYGRAGAPWEFNLRDVFRWCDVIVNFQENLFKNYS